ncbi:CHAT domain-containing protein [Russula compacta]|nr:CHAT domain-containing protein [Russula compacta]
MATPGSHLLLPGIDNYISQLQNILLTFSRSHPLRFTYLSTLAMVRLMRYELSDEIEYLDKSIAHSTEAILLPSNPPIEPDLNIITTLYYLAYALFLRSQKLKQPWVLNYCIEYLCYLRDQSLETSRVPRSCITTFLERALAVQVELEYQIEHMLATLSRYFEAIKDMPPLSVQVPPDEVFECLREAIISFPHFSVGLCFILALSHQTRFYQTHSHDDYDEAMSIVDKFLTDPSHGGQPVKRLMKMAAELATHRFYFYQNPGHLEEAIFRGRTLLSAMSFEDSDRRYLTLSLGVLEKIRFDQFGVRSDPQGDNAEPEVIDHLPLAASPQVAISNIREFVFVTVPDERWPDPLGPTSDLADIQGAIEECRLSLTYPHSDVPNTLYKLGYHLFCAFHRTDNIDYLNESVAVYRDLLKTSDGRSITRFSVVLPLMSSLLSRFSLFNDRKDLDEIMQLFSIAATDAITKVPDRFRTSCMWVRLASRYRHPSTPSAFESAISLMQESLAFAPTLEIQYSRLVATRDLSEKLSSDYASYQVHIGQLNRAIEILERGRGLIWSEMRGLRTSIDQLRAVDLPLAHKFAAVNRDLEALTMSGSSRPSMNNLQVAIDRGDGMDPFGRLVVKQQKLVEERAQLISQIQSLPGFETFLSPPSFDTIRSAASRGPVIIINHSEWRSDIIILLRDSPPSLIQTSTNFYDRGKSLKDWLLAARNKGLDSREYEDALSDVLKELYDLVGRPVIEKLHKLNVPEQSRVWWCPTSVFCSLPLHAMGPVRSDGRMKLYFSDLYIPSYTPTLSALIESRKPSAQALDEPSILLVVQPDGQMPKSLEEIHVVQTVCPSVETLGGKMATPIATLEGLKHHRFAHISCHGILEIGKPFDAFFKLYGGAQLTLLDIVRSRLPTAEFAFLSACHTAEITEDSIADEGLHLAAAVQYSGFRSVVGTMWAMADIDGPVVAGHFYRSVFSDRWEGVPYFERTAEALRDAVRGLRRKRRMTLERWVNYVHYGA